MTRLSTFDLDALRTFVTGIELGSFALAAEQLHRSTSAVSAQLKKLEASSELPLVQKNGRHLTTTPQGELLLSYARRLLALNDEATLALSARQLAGDIRIGMQEDFGESLLPSILGQFSRAHPQVQISARIGRNTELLQAIRQQHLDLALCWQGAETLPHTTPLSRVALHWIGSPQFDVASLLARGEPVPLLLFDAPCLMRSHAIDALDGAGIAWRVAFSSHSLSGIWAAATAGLGITIRTTFGMPASLVRFAEPGLPALPQLDIVLCHASAQLAPAEALLHKIIAEQLI